MLYDLIDYNDFQRNTLEFLVKSGIDISNSKLLDPNLSVQDIGNLTFALVHGLNVDDYLDDLTTLYDVCMLILHGKVIC